jgi:hypothetical protein
MNFSTANSGLPASRTDALSIVALGVISSFLGATPGEGKGLAITATALVNIWAIVSSAITARDVYNNPNDIERHLWLLLLALLVLTVVTSVLTLVVFLGDDSDTIFQCAFSGGMLVVAATYVFGLVEIIMAYTISCQDASFKKSAMCHHSTEYVVGTVVGVGVAGLVGAVLVFRLSKHNSDSVFHNLYKKLTDRLSYDRYYGYDRDDRDAVSNFGAILTRTSALAKACLLGIYWFLVDADLSWDYTITGYDMNWWVTGQWGKQGAALANNVFNHLC